MNLTKKEIEINDELDNKKKKCNTGIEDCPDNPAPATPKPKIKPKIKPKVTPKPKIKTKVNENVNDVTVTALPMLPIADGIEAPDTDIEPSMMNDIDENIDENDDENDDDEFCNQEHTITITLNGYALPEFINLMSLAKHHCDRFNDKEIGDDNGGSMYIPNCQCGNDEMHDNDGQHKIMMGDDNLNQINDIKVDDTDYSDWITEQCKKNKITATGSGMTD